ncbi:DUF4064 domain-containing protein [Planococcus chinensis]|uniref:DUF4064 domain-containing protein n=1 Tax=Planococcus chinensis TaxID=272917 RepID=A0ABW4QJB9_9BACL
MNEERDVSRAGEKTLGIIGIVFNVLGIALLIFAILGLGNIENDPEFRQMLEEQIVADPTIGDVGDTQALIDGLLTSFDVVAWVIVALLVLSTIFALFAVARLGHNRKPKAAGVMFIVAGVLAGLMSLTSILFYIAAIMCLVRKPRNNNGDYNNDKQRYDNDRLRDQDSVRHEENRLREVEHKRDEGRLREEEHRRAEEQRLQEEHRKLEEERHKMEQQRIREQEQHTDNDTYVEREDLKRRADERLRKDSDNRPL